MVRSDEEKVEMILCYGESGRNAHQSVRLYNDKFPAMVVDRAYMRCLVHKFTTKFNLNDAPRSGRPSTFTEEDEIEMLARFTVNPHSSLRMAASEDNSCTMFGEAIAKARTKKREVSSSNFQPHFRKVKPSILVGDSLRALLPIQEFLAEMLRFSKLENLVDHATRQQPAHCLHGK
ncbi:hypothetical protein J6590_029909 [Homalodisca vitripennis]|nr:hypothetical protein J6590_029909 [Homalodisca vitripennis]